MALTTPKTLRGVAALRHLYCRKQVVVVCQDDPSEWETLRDGLSRHQTELVVEQSPGPLSAMLGRPSLTVCDRYLDVSLHAEEVDPDRVLHAIRLAECRCEECPQAADEIGSPWATI